MAGGTSRLEHSGLIIEHNILNIYLNRPSLVINLVKIVINLNLEVLAKYTSNIGKMYSF